jgi:septal ring factor EnvC (AmiA/AmiB activator)
MPAFAAEAPEQRLRTLEQQLEESRQTQTRLTEEAVQLAGEVERLRVASVEAAQAVQQHEAALTELEAELQRLAAEEAEKTAALQKRGGQSVELLMALERLARNPPEALALMPGSPVDAARGATLLGAAIPQIAAKAQALREELHSLAELREATAAKRTQLLVERDALAKQQLALKTLTARKAVLQEAAARGADLSKERLTQLSAEAADLRDLIARLEAERQKREEERRRAEAALRARAEAALRARAAQAPPRPAPDIATAPPAAPPNGVAESADAAPRPATAEIGKPAHLRPFAEARGAVLMPAAGPVKLHYGESDEYGAPSKGIAIRTRPGAQVVAPFDGRVEFAGPFRGYGQILIIEHGDGYHSLLAGLERIEATVGQWLVAGEPVGTMPNGDRDATLYLELRRHGQPINPLPWLATRDDKVSG